MNKPVMIKPLNSSSKPTDLLKPPSLPLPPIGMPPPQQPNGTIQKQVKISDLQKAKFFIATPCYGGALTEPYFKSTLRLVFFADKHGIPLQFGTVANESLVTRARNTLVAFFMQSDCTHLVFIDADIEYQVDDFVRLFAANKDVAVGAYPKKGVNWEAIKQFVKANPEASPQEVHQAGSDYAINFNFKDPTSRAIEIEEGLIALKDAGTGFMMIKRECIEKLMKAHPELQYNNDLNVDKSIDKWSYALFDTKIDSDRRYLSEDYTFCRRWQALGGSIWLDPFINLNHFGFSAFPGNPALIFEQRPV